VDIPGTPPGLETDGPNYYKFLIVMRGQLAEGISLSIAAPASYWYLKAFPIDLMAKELDYIVFMTYDLHGESPSTGDSLWQLTSDRPMGCRQPVCNRRLPDRELSAKSRWAILLFPKLPVRVTDMLAIHSQSY
jgi:hypothetical protein